jgi:hypothetical protein
MEYENYKIISQLLYAKYDNVKTPIFLVNRGFLVAFNSFWLG